MATKAYFIGLGGCGLKTVSALQQKLCPNGPNNQDKTQDTYEFTYIDTDSATLDKINSDNIVIYNGDFVLLGDTNPFQVYRHHEGGATLDAKRFNEWIIPQNQSKKFVLQNTTLRDGAGAERMRGRIGLFNCYGDIERQISDKLAKFQAYQPGVVPEEDIWVVASSCGGTGSSITLDVLYLISKIVAKNGQHAPNLKLVLFMPQVFIDKNLGDLNYPLNAFSYMWEMNAFRLAHQQGLGNIFKYFSAHPDGLQDTPVTQFELFRYIIPVDIETSFDARIELDNLYPTVAEMMYYLNVGAAANTMVSNMSNDMNNLRATTYNETRSQFEWTRPLVAYGYRVIKKANDELKQYVRTRGVYEVLKYGFIGESLQNDPIYREQVKKEFGQQYVLCHLCGIPIEGVVATEQSLQSKLNALYDEVRIPQGDITANECKGCLSRLEGKKDDLKNIELEALNVVKKRIDEGVKKSIVDFGLEYTLDLLNIVDDHYLEKDVITQLKSLYKDARDDVDKLKQNYNKLMQSISDSEKTLKDKVASPIIKVLKDYREALCKEQLYSISLNIIDSLTKSTTGYLEILRKKSPKSKGLREVLDKIKGYCSTWSGKYKDLAEEFRKSKSNAFTVNIPDLAEIATGNNSDWAPENLFDQLYCASIIDYDHNKKVESGLKAPLRKGESGTNFLATYIEPLVEPLFEIALQEDSFRFESNLKTQFLEKIVSQINGSVNQHGSEIQRWIDMKLSEVLDSGQLPGGKTKAMFINELSNRATIPVLYPLVSGGATVPNGTNYIYAGASQELAQSFGYNEMDNTRNQFIPDATMTDRLLIMKMPLGLDFISYKYFEDIQRIYDAKASEIKDGHWGCHLHREFSKLDLNNSVRLIQEESERECAYYFAKMLYYQTLINCLKTKDRNLYNKLFGIIEFVNDSMEENSSSEDLDDFFGDTNKKTNSRGSILTVDEDVDDQFFNYNIDLKQKTVDITIKDININDKTLTLGANTINISFSQNEYGYVGNFVRKLMNTSNMEKALRKVELIQDLLKQYNFQLNTIEESLTTEILNKGTKESLRFTVIFEKWMKDNNKEEKHVLKAISKALNGKSL